MYIFYVGLWLSELDFAYNRKIAKFKSVIIESKASIMLIAKHYICQQLLNLV